MRLKSAVTAALVVLALPASHGSAQQLDEFRWTGAVPAGRAVEVKGVLGGVRAERATGQQVEVVARKTARRSDPAEVTIEVIEHAGGVTLCALYPTPPRQQQPNQCAPGSAGRMSTSNNDVQVEWVVRVPDGVNLVARTVNGGVEVDAVRGNVDARTTNGGVRVSAGGVVRASTTNGPIDVTMGSVGTGDLEFRTTNGSITLTMPAGLNAEVRAQTTNGSISSDFPITVSGTFGPRRLEGVIGTGGRRLVLQTTNGNVVLRQAGE